MPLPLSPTFFDRPTLRVARDLIGCTLARKIGGKTVRAMITETEAYDGHDDLASHASRGETPRNKIMFGRAGYWYVYFTYGIHWMLNVTTGPEGYPAAVLVRGIEGTNGPARLTKKLGIDGRLNKRRVTRASGLWIERSKKKIPKSRIITSPRIGIDYSGPIWSKKHYRFVLKSER